MRVIECVVRQFETLIYLLSALCTQRTLQKATATLIMSNLFLSSVSHL